MKFMTFHQLGISSSQLTSCPSFFRGVGIPPTTLPTGGYQVRFLCKHLPAIHVPGVAQPSSKDIWGYMRAKKVSIGRASESSEVAASVELFWMNFRDLDVSQAQAARKLGGIHEAAEGWDRRQDWAPRDWSDRPGKSWEIAVGNPGKASLYLIYHSRLWKLYFGLSPWAAVSLKQLLDIDAHFFCTSWTRVNVYV